MEKNKALVIGLDGVPHSLLAEYAEAGLMPNLKKILSCGYVQKRMDASIPDVSSISWTSFMTGVNPGEHGIFGFIDLRPESYKMFFPNYGDVQAPAIWEILGQTSGGKSSTLFERYRGKIETPLRSIVMNVPQTFPAPSLNGVLTAGFVCPDLKRGTYPDSAYEYLHSIGYLPDVDVAKAVNDPDAFFKELHLALDRRAEAFTHFMETENWDLFIAVITETDRLHHFFFDAARNESHPRHKDFLSFYKRTDEVIGVLFDRFMEITGGEGFFMTMSDHGFCELKEEVYVNSLLREKGFLKLDKGREYFEQVGSGATAFCMDPARLYINIEGRYPLGCVKASGMEKISSELRGVMESLKDADGNRVIKSVYGRDDLYAGPLSGRAPDLVCVANDGYDLKGTLIKEEIFGKGAFTGMHVQNDAHCVLPERVKTSEKMHIEHLAGILLEQFIDVK